jgi:hypothetical protein
MLPPFEILPTCFVKRQLIFASRKYRIAAFSLWVSLSSRPIRVDNWGATVEKIEEFVRVAAHFQPQLANNI